VVDEPDELLDDLWNKVRDRINEVLDETTIEQLAERKKNNDQNFMYYI
jgi:Rrf2 family transcriptional regulator, cysteine metabolism repressor